jgi:hypothetical protein
VKKISYWWYIGGEKSQMASMADLRVAVIILNAGLLLIFDL